MATLESLQVLIGADISGLSTGIAQAETGLSRLASTAESASARLGSALKGAGSALTAGVTVPLTLVGGAALKMAGDLEVAKVAFTTMLGSAEAANQTLSDLKAFAADTPFEFPEIQEAAKKLLAFNTPAKDLKETLRQLGDISAGIGAPIGEIADLFGKARVQGRLFQEDINQLTGRGIPIIQELAKQFNVTDDAVRKLVESGKVNFGNLQTAFADLTKEGGKFGGLMAAQSATLPGLFSTLTDNIGQALGGLGADIAKELNLKEVIKQVSSFVQDAANAFQKLSPGVKSGIIVFAAVAAAAGPVVFALGSVVAAIPAVIAGFEALGIASTAALGPIGIGVAAVAAAALLIYENWDSVVSYFKGPAGDVFSGLGKSIADAFEAASTAIGAFVAGPIGQAIASVGKFALTLSGGVLAGAVAGISSSLQLFAGNIRIVTDLFRGDFQQALADGAATARSVAEPFRELLGLGQTKSASFADFFKGILPAAKGAGDAVDYFSDEIVKVGEQAGVLQKLKEQLKALQEQREKETTIGAIRVDTSQIEALQKKIADLEGTSKGSASEIAKAYESLQKGLRTAAGQSQALGDAFDYIGARRSALQSGITGLISAGLSPLSATIKGLVKDLNSLPTAVDQISGRVAKGLEKINDTPAFELKLPDQLALPELLEPDYAGVFDRAAQGVLAGGGKLQDSLISVNDGATAQLAQFQLAGEMFSDNINDVLGQGFTNIAVGFGEAVGQILSGASGLEALPSLVLGALGGLAIQVGELAIGVGIAVAGIKAALETLNPIVAIAGGIALVALGSAVKSIASNIGKGGGGTSLSSAPASNFKTSSAAATQQQPIKVVAEFVLRGKDLVAIGKSEDYRVSRTG